MPAPPSTEDLSEPTGTGSSTVWGSFWPDMLVMVVNKPRTLYLEAYEHFTGVPLRRDEQRSDRAQVSAPHVGAERERELTVAMITFQHELRHWHQVACTATGSYLYQLAALHHDFNLGLVKHIGHFQRVERRNSRIRLPMIDTLKEKKLNHELDIGKSAAIGFNTMLDIFNSNSLSRGELVEVWNSFTTFLDDSAPPSDSIRFVRIAEPTCPDDLGNPEGLSLIGLLEGAAHCQDMQQLFVMPVAESTIFQIVSETEHGPYRQLLDYLAEIINPGFADIIAPRIAYIALQGPLTTHYADHAQAAQLDDVSPTIRAKRIINALARGDFGDPHSFLDVDVDEVCAHFGWISVSALFNEYLAREHFRGASQILDFMNGMRRDYCTFALQDPQRQSWLSSMGRVDGAAEFGASFLPPFAAFTDEVVIQTSSRVPVLALSVLTGVAAEDLLYQGDLERTQWWLDQLLRALAQGRDGKNVVTAFQDLWVKAFSRSFDLEWKDFA